VISGFRREVEEKYALLCYCATSSVISYRRFRTTYRSHFQGLTLHVVDSKINEAAVSLGSSNMSLVAHALLLLLFLLLLLPLLLLRRKKQSMKGKKKDKKKRKDPLFYFFLPSLLQLYLSSHYLSVFLRILLQQKENKK